MAALPSLRWRARWPPSCPGLYAVMQRGRHCLAHHRLDLWVALWPPQACLPQVVLFTPPGCAWVEGHPDITSTVSQALKTGDLGLWLCFLCHDFSLNSQCACILHERTQSDSFCLRGSPQNLHCSNTRVQRLVGRSNMGYWRTHFFAFLISTLISLLFHRRREPNCKWVEGDLEKNTGWPLRIHWS